MDHVKHSVCAVISSFCGFVYITTLFLIALFHHALTSAKPAGPFQILPRPERKLTFDLEYYLNLQGYGLEHHEVITQDEYVLDCQRIVAPGSELDEKPRYPILLIPGLMQSSSAYCTAGPDAIALVLARLGYDVWLGNNRGGFRPKHLTIKNDFSAKLWDWEMHELATKDVPAMVEYVKRVAHTDQIAVTAHSQGTTQTFRALAVEEHGGIPDLGLSMSSFCALAPAVYAGPLVDRWFLRLLRVPKQVYHTFMGYHAFIGMMGSMRPMLPLKLFTFVAYIVFNYMLGWDDKLWDRHYRDRNFVFAPVYVSAKLMFWWLGEGGFAHRKCVFASEDSKWFDHRFPPLEIYACGRDNLVLPDRLINRIHNFEPDAKPKTSIVNLPGYSHLDVMWAMDASQKVALPIAEFAWKHVREPSKWKTPSIPSAISMAPTGPPTARSAAPAKETA